MKRISHPEKSFFASSWGTRTRRENEEREGGGRTRRENEERERGLSLFEKTDAKNFNLGLNGTMSLFENEGIMSLFENEVFVAF